jgi:hypothetical protein
MAWAEHPFDASGAKAPLCAVTYGSSRSFKPMSYERFCRSCQMAFRLLVAIVVYTIAAAGSVVSVLHLLRT